MKIECPKCFKENNLHLAAKVKCGNCQEELTGKTFKKTIMSGGAILAIGLVGGQVAEYAFFDNRYPMNVEYSIIEACTSSYQEPVSRAVYGNRKKVCLCAMEDTMNEISYIRYKVEKKAFLSAFEENANKCMKRKE
ncbi:MAG: hypothetical protein H6999_10750 [Hahellaceae bacterium]|nr:hypothetical protein [Hahellaceae bacterium]